MLKDGCKERDVKCSDSCLFFLKKYNSDSKYLKARNYSTSFGRGQALPFGKGNLRDCFRRGRYILSYDDSLTLNMINRLKEEREESL